VRPTHTAQHLPTPILPTTRQRTPLRRTNDALVHVRSWLEEGETILQRELQRREVELAMLDADAEGKHDPQAHNIEKYGRHLQDVVTSMHGMLAEESSYHGAKQNLPQ